MDDTIKAALAEAVSLRKAPVPPSMTIDRCHFSRTGWALWKQRDGKPWACTCRPTRPDASAIEREAREGGG